jgi:predicted PhzF superfamily epimerase YddE/YHI9
LPELHVLRVFTDEEGRHGNPLGVFLDGGAIPEASRQGVAADLGFSETVFVDDRSASRIRIFTPSVELPFAGHPTVGTAWLLARTGSRPQVLRPPAGEAAVHFDGELTYVQARPEWASGFELVELESPAEVDALRRESGWFWAWADRAARTVRARAFFPEYGIDEDEATGAAAILLTGRVGRPLRISQGAGSLLLTRPLPGGWVELGGRVALDQRREYSLS